MGKEDVVHIYILECFSVIRRNEKRPFLMMWINIESVVRSAVSQKEKNKYCVLMKIYRI